MTDGDDIAVIRHQLVSTAGGYLRNLIPGTDTCTVCYTPCSETTLCDRCARDAEINGLPDARGFMTYASYGKPIEQSGHVMRAYKANLPSHTAWRTVFLLAALAVRGHRHCPERLVGSRPTAWASVPSLPPKGQGIHPLHNILTQLAKPGSKEIALSGVDDPTEPREIDVTHFRVETAVPAQTHVLLIDDTWTGGGHSQSAALALRAAGARHVSLLVLARWLSPGYGDTTSTWMHSHLTAPDYDATICPWTQGACPPP